MLYRLTLFLNDIPMQEIHITTRLSQADYIRASFDVLWRKTMIRVVMLAVAATWLITLWITAATKKEVDAFTFLPFLFFLLFFAILYFSLRNSYKTNPRAAETIAYHFGTNRLFVKGESFEVQLSWDKIYKVTLGKHFLLIWQNASGAQALPRRDVWESHVAALKDILELHHVKNNL